MTEKNNKETTLGEKGVYRRRLGILGFIAGVGAFISGGFDWFSVDVAQLWAILGTSGGLMGIGIAKDVFNKGNGNQR